MKKRIVSLILALALAMGLTSGLVFADDSTLEIDGGEINAGEILTYDFDGYTILILSFTPTESGTYEINVDGNSMISVTVTTEVTFATDFYSFSWSSYGGAGRTGGYFEAGVTYYIQVVFWGTFYDDSETCVSVESCEMDLEDLEVIINIKDEHGINEVQLTEGTDYTVTGGSEIVTISENYIKSLDADKEYTVFIGLDYYVYQTLIIGDAETDSSSETGDSDADDSDDSGSMGTDTSSDDSAVGTDDTSADSLSLSIIDSETTASYTLGSGTAAVIAVDADIDTFVSVTVDGTVLTQDTDYTVTEGSTIITFAKSFLETLSEGDHDVVIAFEDGDVETTLTIVSAESSSDSDDSEESEAAEVGDSSSLALWMALGLLAALGLAGTGLRRRAAR